MADLWVRNIAPHLKRRIAESARKSRNSLSDEAIRLIERGLADPVRPPGMGTLLFSLVREEDRGDDLVFEVSDNPRRPPEFD